MKDVLVFGQTGQVARELARHAGVTCLSRAEADLTAPEACDAAIRAHGPRAVINAAAYTAVDRAESEPALAHLINAATPGTMARTCADMGIPFVQISTDYVFDGSGEAPWRPEDPTAPLNTYGRSKLAGERAVIAAGGAHAVLRTSWVVSAHGSNFVKTMLRLGKTRDSLNVVADQIGAPTPARDIAAACLTIAEALIARPEAAGVYHLAGAPDTSWAGFARETFDQAGIACRVEEIPTSAYPTPAARPGNSRLDCATLETVFGLARPDWRQGLHAILHDLGEI
ncbi:dTDP-4-dehydrorhamnose reductase [Pseudodonghicola flavimaris]|uniref:dTDP-4-dehydrorhamnose reductase n=1 Tax=Pseudodonghicola flavimaris TaxID=3050036 RepID=A0ABT7F854_9RHOB|nr:dTDP-4-dehydrorhamnose reductase [Pseudodonghicola flavimaris]MDK3020790.1 dTDP-4-dehydrorhamnose reductase [Pseudodonghicola flavimaris]